MPSLDEIVQMRDRLHQYKVRPLIGGAMRSQDEPLHCRI